MAMQEAAAPADAGREAKMQELQESSCQPERIVSTEVFSQKQEKFSTTETSNPAIAAHAVQLSNIETPLSSVEDTNTVEKSDENVQYGRGWGHCPPHQAQNCEPIQFLDIAVREPSPSQRATAISQAHDLPFIIRERSAEPEDFKYRPAPNLIANISLFRRPSPGYNLPKRVKPTLLASSESGIEAGG